MCAKDNRSEIIRELERRREVAEGLREIFMVLNSKRSLAEVMDLIIAQAKNMLGADEVGIYQLEIRGDRLVLLPTKRTIADPLTELNIPVKGSIITETILQKQPLVLPDTNLVIEHSSPILPNDEQRAMLRQLFTDYRAALAVPFIVKDEVYGGIVLYYREPRQFTEDDVKLASAIGDQAALAIEHERMDAQSREAAVSEERNRLARELHDAVTQTLFSASLIAEVLPQIWEKNPDEGRRRLGELRELTKGALAEMRALLLELRPAAIVEADLGDLVNQLAEAAAGSSRIPIQTEIVKGVRLPAEQQVAFYRIAQEGLNNVVKHSCATQVSVSLAVDDGRATLRIADDGYGFNRQATAPDSLGLSIMRERAVTAGIDLDIISRPDEGTTVTAAWIETQRSANGKG